MHQCASIDNIKETCIESHIKVLVDITAEKMKE